MSSLITKKTLLAVLAAICLSPLVDAQENDLNLVFEPMQGIPGVYSFVETNTRVRLTVDALRQDALVFVAIQAASSLGDIDLRSAQMLVPVTKLRKGRDLNFDFMLPVELAGQAFSVQAVAQLDHQTILTSPVVTMIVQSHLHSQEDSVGAGRARESKRQDSRLAMPSTANGGGR